ncbi:MAG: winged helix-turn-helix domain-containing protein [Aestuariibacter sp.]
MNQELQTLGYRVVPATGNIITPAGDTVSVRPKTFELLLFLLQSFPKRVSKEQIMDVVWHDVVVGEHVVFQSIREIRQLFPEHDPIKTVPRQGYCWTSEVTVSTDAPQHKGNTDVSPSITQKTRRSIVQAGLMIASLILVAALLLHSKFEPQALPGSIIVLPVKNQISGSDHDWVSLGAMDQLISTLQSSTTQGVLHTDYVLDVMNRAGAPFVDYEDGDIEQMFVVSGASLIIELTLSGVTRDYQLIFNLHRRHGSERGALFAESIPEALDELALLINRKTGLTLSSSNTKYPSDFANELVANGLLASYQNRKEQSEQFYNAALATEPENIAAMRLLAKQLIENQDNRAEHLLKTALKLVAGKPKSQKEEVRLLFWSALYHFQRGEIELGQPFLQQAEELASDINDWLYLAYIEEIRGQLAQRLAHYKEAEEHYFTAINYHRVLQCPHGESNGYLNISRLAHQSGDDLAARNYAEKAEALTKKRQLTVLHKEASAWMSSLATEQ